MVPAVAIVVREGQVDDTEDVTHLLASLGYDIDANEVSVRLTALITHPDHAVWVAERHGKVAGVTAACTTMTLEKGKVARLTALVVAESARGHGVGSALVDEVERWAAERHARF